MFRLLHKFLSLLQFHVDHHPCHRAADGFKLLSKILWFANNMGNVGHSSCLCHLWSKSAHTLVNCKTFRWYDQIFSIFVEHLHCSRKPPPGIFVTNTKPMFPRVRRHKFVFLPLTYNLLLQVQHHSSHLYTICPGLIRMPTNNT